jgi:hypothetical protein
MIKKINIIMLFIFGCAVVLTPQTRFDSFLENPSNGIIKELSSNLNLAHTNYKTNLTLQLPQDRISADPFGRTIRNVITANLAYGIITGKFNEEYTSLLGPHLTLGYLFSTSFMLTASSGYLNYTFKEDFPEGVNYNFNVIPIMLGMKYILSKYDLKVYLMFQLGLHLLNSSYSIEFTSQTEEDSQTEAKFGIHPGIGLMQKLSDNFLIDANIHYSLTSIVPDNLSALVFMLGVAYAFE